tara:strand:- start:640 stop:747 length:108 start_codon:yes stop_codon:yes gene_type:complete
MTETFPVPEGTVDIIEDIIITLPDTDKVYTIPHDD